MLIECVELTIYLINYTKNTHIGLNKIFTFVKEKFNMDIYQNEGIYFPNFDFFLTNNIKTIFTKQKKGDIILVGIGAIHW